MLEQKVDIFIMAGKRKQLSNDIKNVSYDRSELA
jgi:hypothetical protein